MKKILLLGSGELGKEFVISAKRLGCHVVACDSYAGAPSDTNVWKTGICTQRVLRGGSWNEHRDFVRSASRLWSEPALRGHIIGFRISRTLP